MKVLVSGSSGLVGSALLPSMSAHNHEVVRLVRRSPGAGEVQWDPAAGTIDRAALAGVEAVVHLAGENVAGGRWNAARKARIRGSRVDGTALLCDALAEAPPKIFVGASAIGYYGSRGDEELTEDSGPGDGFLAQTCVAWENATTTLPGETRRVLLRIGIVLALSGGALGRMSTPFLCGLGGRLGSGRQFMSWITLDDIVQTILFALHRDQLSGPCNATAPEPCTNRVFTAALARVLRRPAILPVPAFALRMALGELADSLLLASARVLPRRLQEHGFPFGQTEIEPALRAVLGR